jgi:hypothetical protein
MAFRKEMIAFHEIRNHGDQVHRDLVRVPRLHRSPVPGRERGCREAVLPRNLASISRCRIDAIPRGPSHPMQSVVFRSSPVPMREIATGSLRTMVNLNTA